MVLLWILFDVCDLIVPLKIFSSFSIALILYPIPCSCKDNYFSDSVFQQLFYLYYIFIACEFVQFDKIYSTYYFMNLNLLWCLYHHSVNYVILKINFYPWRWNYFSGYSSFYWKHIFYLFNNCQFVCFLFSTLVTCQ